MTIDHGLPPMSAPPRGRDDLGETPRPPHDPSVAVLAGVLPTEPLTPERIPETRGVVWLTPERLAEAFPVHLRYVDVPGFDGASLRLAVIRRVGDDAVGPGLFWIHGGGMIGGEPLGSAIDAVPHLLVHGGTVLSVEYRLAPEHPAPIPVEDCYAALVWCVDHAAELGFDPDRMILGGGSAGGGLAAGVALLARDRQGPALVGAMLHCPMLDDRNDSTSIRQFDRSIGWSGQNNAVGWGALLGEARGTDAVSPYDAPARATWLGGLPPVHISVGSADPFRTEDVAFAEGIWRDGGDCELYVLPGGHHGYEVMVPKASISVATLESRRLWVNRILNPDDTATALENLAQIAAAMGVTPS